MRFDLQNIMQKSRPLKVLYVEDDKETRDLTKELFDSFFENIFVAEDYQKALEIFLDEEIDLVITDVLLEGKSGVELAKKIKSYKDVPIILFSAYDKNRFNDLECIDCFLLKPIDLNSFMRVLMKVL